MGFGFWSLGSLVVGVIWVYWLSQVSSFNRLAETGLRISVLAIGVLGKAEYSKANAPTCQPHSDVPLASLRGLRHALLASKTIPGQPVKSQDFIQSAKLAISH